MIQSDMAVSFGSKLYQHDIEGFMQTRLPILNSSSLGFGIFDAHKKGS